MRRRRPFKREFHHVRDQRPCRSRIAGDEQAATARPHGGYHGQQLGLIARVGLDQLAAASGHKTHTRGYQIVDYYRLARGRNEQAISIRILEKGGEVAE